MNRKNMSMKAKRRNVGLDKKQTPPTLRICLLVSHFGLDKFILWFLSFHVKGETL